VAAVEARIRPEMVGYHLESGDAANAAGWSGRTTAPFTLEKP
jgi:hypothetical protein